MMLYICRKLWASQYSKLFSIHVDLHVPLSSTFNQIEGTAAIHVDQKHKPHVYISIV